jgi:FMN phosphatase YigB (HAD superfamily)
MTFNLLLDLDDTLLDTNLDAFLPVYIKKLASITTDKIPVERFASAMLRSTQLMYENKRPDKTLEQVFDQHFYPAIGMEKPALAETIEKFYDEVFPTLGTLTSPRPEAISLVEWAFSKGWKVSIATDPLFPRKAILHRLRWAGLDPEKYPFTLISDFHSFHFAKKSIAYYPEFLARLGWTDEPVLMVGDSIERDIAPSRIAGVPVFWLNKDSQGQETFTPRGWYPNLKDYLENTDLSTLEVSYKSPGAKMAFLDATVAVFHSFFSATRPDDWTRRIRAGEWSFLEVMCHLRDVDLDVNLPRLSAMVQEVNPLIPGKITDQWAEERNYIKQDPFIAFGGFVTARNNILELLRRLGEDDWNRMARHTLLGPTRLGELVEFIVDHDRLHLRQAAAAISWPEYNLAASR